MWDDVLLNASGARGGLSFLTYFYSERLSETETVKAKLSDRLFQLQQHEQAQKESLERVRPPRAAPPIFRAVPREPAVPTASAPPKQRHPPVRR
eukprot:SAG11_NODE_167_length_13647_cov_7.705049_19_plen_94_part_00